MGVVRIRPEGKPGKRDRSGGALADPAADAGRLMLTLAAGIAFGHVQAVGDVTLRRICGWIPAPEDMASVALDAVPGWVLAVDQTRLAAMILGLICFGLLAGRDGWQRLGAVLLALGTWRLTATISLRLMAGWPTTFGARELLTAYPGPVVAPVWMLVVISLGLVALGLGALKLSRMGRG